MLKKISNIGDCGITCDFGEDVDKKTHKMKLHGLASRVFQHEYDHMEGIDFQSLAGRLSLDIAKRKLKRAQRKMKKMQENQ